MKYKIIFTLAFLMLTACSTEEPQAVQKQRNAYRAAQYSIGVAQESARQSRTNTADANLLQKAGAAIQEAKDTGVITSNLETQLANLKAQADKQ